MILTVIEKLEVAMEEAMSNIHTNPHIELHNQTNTHL